MKLFLLSTLLFISLIANGQTWVIKTKKIDSVEYFVYPDPQDKDLCCLQTSLIWAAQSKSRKLPDGKWVIFFKEDKTKIAAFFEIKDRKPHGKMREFHFNGNIKYDAIYEYGETRQFTFWRENGKISETGQYKLVNHGSWIQPTNTGIWKLWYKEGPLESVKIYDEEGNKHGAQTTYYKNGAKHTEQHYNRNLLDSMQTCWYPNGQLQEQLKYEKDLFIPQNPHRIYYANGQIYETGNLVLARKSGLWVSNYETGELQSKGNYDTITYIEYESHPFPVFSSVKTGKWTYYHTNGQIMAEGEFDELNAPQSHKKGNWQYRDEHGNPVTEEFINRKYKLDQMIKGNYSHLDRD